VDAVSEPQSPLSRELLVLRHGKSAWDTGAPTDFERPLAPRGKRDAPRMGRWLDAQGLKPDHVVSSPARRARQTARRVAKALDLDREEISYDERVYESGLYDLLAVLAECPAGCRRVLLVGHNPGLEILVEHLGGSAVTIPEDGKLLPTATVAHLRMPTDWSTIGTGAAELVSVTRPKELTAEE
jgi:phosphohistidine phosphatase